MVYSPSFEKSDPLIVKPTIEKVKFTRKSKKVKTPTPLTKKVFRKEDLEDLQIQRGMLYPSLTIKDFLVRIKDCNNYQYTEIMKWNPASEWDRIRDETQSKITARVAERHVDLIADNEDLFLKTTKLGMTRIIEMLTKLKVSDTPELVKVRDPITGKDKSFKKIQLRSVDIANLMVGLKSGMEIYRNAMGLTEASGGMIQVLNQIRDMMGGDVNLTQINFNAGPKAENVGQEKILEIAENDYDSFFELIEMKRRLKNKSEAVDVEVKNVVE